MSGGDVRIAVPGVRMLSLATRAVFLTAAVLGTVPVQTPHAAGAAQPAAAPGQAQEPALTTVLRRAAAYVDELHRRLTGVVMEERYEQTALDLRGSLGRERVRLRSDYLLVQIEGSRRQFGFRDVFEANGRAVRDRDERLTELFLDPAATTLRQIQGILRESARYNVGDVDRNVNTPTLALLFLRSGYNLRSRFERSTDTGILLDLEAPPGAADAWVISFEEDWPTSVIRGRDDGNLPASGRFWIDPATGTVVITELILDSEDLESIITVRYAPDETLGHFVPVEMRERYRNHDTGSRIRGTATYSRFRQFRVIVDEGVPLRD